MRRAGGRTEGGLVNYAVVFAGGSGVRMNTRTTPKQFLRIHGRTILEHTLAHFEDHPLIDGIAVACLESWIPALHHELATAGFTKVRWIVPGGQTGQESIRNALEALRSSGVPEDAVVLVHDGVRPVIDEETITRNIDSVRAHGSAITVSPQWETVVCVDSGSRVEFTTNRMATRVAKAPQSFLLGELSAAHSRAVDEGRGDFIDSATLMGHFGHDLHTVDGPADNIKVTTATDFYVLRAILDAREAVQVFG